MYNKFVLTFTPSIPSPWQNSCTCTLLRRVFGWNRVVSDIVDEFPGPRRRRLDWKRVRRASNNARNYGAAVGHPDACRQCPANVPSHLPILSHFCAWTVCLCARACIGNRSILTFVSGRQWAGRARSIERRKRREYGFARTFFLSFLES